MNLTKYFSEFSVGHWMDWWKQRSTKEIVLPALLAVFYIGANGVLGGLRIDHFLTAFLFLIFYFGRPYTQSLFNFLLPLGLMFIMYDGQAYFADALRPDYVRVQEPYNFDKTFFGISTESGVLVPSHWFQNHTHPALDLLAGLAYISFIPVFLCVAAYFHFFLWKTEPNEKIKSEISNKAPALMWGMFWLNILCCTTYYFYPAAPPWYAEQYGLGPARMDVAPSPAGGARVDALLGITLFAEFYSRTPNVFGAIPSIHVAFPLLSVYFAFKFNSLRVFCFSYFLVIAFSAVYLNHHYIIDLIWGAIYALAVGWTMDRFYSWRLPQKGIGQTNISQVSSNV